MSDSERQEIGESEKEKRKVCKRGKANKEEIKRENDLNREGKLVREKRGNILTTIKLYFKDCNSKMASSYFTDNFQNSQDDRRPVLVKKVANHK